MSSCLHWTVRPSIKRTRYAVASAPQWPLSRRGWPRSCASIPNKRTRVPSMSSVSPSTTRARPLTCSAQTPGESKQPPQRQSHPHRARTPTPQLSCAPGRDLTVAALRRTAPTMAVAGSTPAPCLCCDFPSTATYSCLSPATLRPAPTMVLPCSSSAPPSPERSLSHTGSPLRNASAPSSSHV
jgi:hypothetical protein